MRKVLQGLCLAAMLLVLAVPFAAHGQGKGKESEPQPITTSKTIPATFPGNRDDKHRYEVKFENNGMHIEFIVKCKQNIPLVVHLKHKGVIEEIRDPNDKKYGQGMARGKELLVRAGPLLASDYIIEVKPQNPGQAAMYTLTVTKPDFGAVAPKGGGRNVGVGGGKADPVTELTQIRKELQSLLERLDRVEKQIGEQKGVKDK